jgi:dihydropteroate synthase
MAAQPSLAPNLSFLSDHSRTWVMGVLNATPDSFYADSRRGTIETALSLTENMMAAGADAIDLGGESTRPGAETIPAAQELARLLPILKALHDRWPYLPLSIDTQKAEVARETLARGASIINDISALRNDPAMAGVVAEAGCPIILMHMKGTPKTMQQEPKYVDVVDEVKKFFEERLAFATAHDIHEDRIILDPGIGFGKTVDHNLLLLKRLKELQSFGRPLLVGISRKSFIGRLLAETPQGILPPEERLEGSLAAALWAVQEGANGLRVHDVQSTRRALTIWNGIRGISS